MNITKYQASNMMRKAGSKIFRAIFTKKNGELRKMICRKGVTAHLKGGERAYDPSKYNLVCVYDMEVGDYRTINVETLQSLRMNGREYSVI